MTDLNWELIEKHLEEAHTKLKAAEYLFNGKFYNDSISRAYYAMFNPQNSKNFGITRISDSHYAAKAALALKDIDTKTHVGVLSQFRLHFIKEGFIDELYAKAYSVAMEDRSEADYGIFSEFTEDEAEIVIEDAEKFIEVVEDMIEKNKKIINKNI